MAFVSINNGYYNTKTIFNGNEHIFKSAVRDAKYEYDTDTVDVDGRELVVGEGDFDVDLNKVASITQKACIKYALRRTKKEHINVVTAMPINSYLNKKARAEYKKMFLDMENVISCTVYMEGMAAALSDFKFYEGRLVCLIDIGGLTINSMLIDNGCLVPDTAFSMKLGTIILENRIRKALEQSDLCNVPQYQIRYMMDNDKVKRVMNDYIREIKQELKKAEYPSQCQMRLTGGGASEYCEFFKNEFGCFISSDAIWENVRGLSVVGGMIYENDSLR